MEKTLKQLEKELGWEYDGYDDYYERLYRKISIKDMVSLDRIYSSKMLSKEGWKKVWKECRTTDHGSEFMMIWQEDNDFDFDYCNPLMEKYGYEIFYNECDDKLYKIEGNLFKTLVDRFCDYLEND